MLCVLTVAAIATLCSYAAVYLVAPMTTEVSFGPSKRFSDRIHMVPHIQELVHIWRRLHIYAWDMQAMYKLDISVNQAVSHLRCSRCNDGHKHLCHLRRCKVRVIDIMVCY